MNKETIKKELNSFIEGLIADGLSEEEAIKATRALVMRLKSNNEASTETVLAQ